MSLKLSHDVCKNDAMLYLFDRRILNEFGLCEEDSDIAFHKKECYSKNRIMRGLMGE
ncbi:hypothetical protein [Bacillus clarus]|uniref:hypothetical protein n=1 Tax=Bacillus clarus TaxID=2338372 RepID=UPI000ABDAD43|nr:hypothetical protein [Bacillus clarus]